MKDVLIFSMFGLALSFTAYAVGVQGDSGREIEEKPKEIGAKSE